MYNSSGELELGQGPCLRTPDQDASAITGTCTGVTAVLPRSRKGCNSLFSLRSLIFPFLIRSGKPMPLYTFASAFMFCGYNGYLQSRYLSQYAMYADDWVTDPRFLVGFCLWLMGMLVNIHSDHILRNLRRPGETGYKIPRGGLFEYVTAANYFGEVVEWSGYGLASWSVQGGAFALFTACFLFTRAQQHHQWYLEKFEDYPKFRKIIIPFLF
ncbi:3-oxo-5-alpha-steroid 4-dehydrogenase 1 [Enhydra lutris kenyoni]|uniref:3-oxo-5alpha-steroid 4-dehydrogenase (NADP(+)) n=1 Tax=Enhydra lutris kenyoni TaxID=391180 RepID=A0A2Y9K960_ENHLU|nr:3-oxo-5-alpha-steroid 4-dehydrogenase 1 [Enhydra lutris kenyoni]